MPLALSDKRLGREILLGLSYFFGAAVGIILTRDAEGIAAFWPPNAIMLGMLLRGSSVRAVPSFILCGTAAVLVNLAFDNGLVFSVGLSLVNMLEVAVALGLTRRWVGTSIRLTDLAVGLKLALMVSVIASGIAALAGAGLVNLLVGVPFTSVVPIWWSGDAVSYILILPAILHVDNFQSWTRFMPARTLELAGIWLLLVACHALMMFDPEPVMLIVFLPLLLWLAVRFDIVSVCVAAIAIVILAVIQSPVSGWILHARHDLTPSEAIARLQLFVTMVTGSALALAILAERNRQSSRAIRQTNGILKTVLDTATSGVLALDKSGRIIMLNSAARRLLDRVEESPPFDWPKEVKFFARDDATPLPPGKAPIDAALTGRRINAEIFQMSRHSSPTHSYVRFSGALVEGRTGPSMRSSCSMTFPSTNITGNRPSEPTGSMPSASSLAALHTTSTTS